MAIERTLSIVKPDGVKAGLTGEILKRFESAGLVIAALRMTRLTMQEAQAFYDVHQERPFFESLTKFMCSGPIVVSVLEGGDAIRRNRELMGATDPAQADSGTIRREYASNIEHNIVHGSDAPETASREIGFFFTESDLVRGVRR
ncbi:MAG: nucleoside-diphosphate kinase [SAR324 cluster bacterium]|nr:nucleoside-diphosphate kinase [SAR324 cluster bacterium]